MPTPSFILPTSVPVVDASVEALRVYDGSPAGFDVLPMSFTRGSSATRTDSAGNVVSAVPYNLLQQSETFDNASWVKTGTTITPNTTTAPNGTLTADTMSIVDSNSRIVQSPSLVAGTYTLSAYVKVLNTTTAGTVRFAPVADGGNVNSFFTPTTEWARYTQTFTANTTFSSVAIRGAGGGFVGDIAVWGVQLVLGTEPLPYQETVTRLALPRLDYRNADGTLSSTPRLLLEPQRTNLVTFSEQFDNAAWSKPRATITANVTTAPNGTLTADLISGSGTVGVQDVLQTSLSIISGSVYTHSIYAKKNTNNFIQLGGGTSPFGANYFVNFDLNNGTVGTVGSSVTGSSIESVGDGWYRCSVSGPAIASSTINSFILWLVSSETAVRAESWATTSSVYIWGAQLEAGTYPTTYIPTTTAAVTRLADACSLTGASSVIGQTEGTMFAEVDIKANSNLGTILSLGSNTSVYIAILKRANNTIGFEVLNSGVQVNISSAAFSNGVIKIAAAYSANDFVLYVNGAQAGTDTSGTVPTTSQVTLGAYPNNSFILSDGITQAALYTTRLSNAELQSLTTL
jgi:hypothetical protein